MPDAVIVQISLQLLLAGDVHRRAWIDQMLDALDAHPLLAPTRWGADKGLRDPYDRETLIRTVEQAHLRKPGSIVPHLHSQVRPWRYRASWYGDDDARMGSLQLETLDKPDAAGAAQWFDACRALVARLPVEWGRVDLDFEAPPHGTRMQDSGTGIHLSRYRREGPECLFPRTFIGPRVLALIDGGEPHVRDAAGLPCRRLDNGVLEVDLLQDPWTHGPAALKKAQRQAHAALADTGIFSAVEGRHGSTPGPRWQSPFSS